MTRTKTGTDWCEILDRIVSSCGAFHTSDGDDH